jgi:hypothetical protein
MRLYGAGGSKVCLLQLAPNLQLTSLHFYEITLHLQTGALHCPSDGLVLATLPLKQLQLDDCVLPGGSKGLRVALSKLPELQYLSISSIFHVDGRCSSICLAVLTKLQHLTYLKLGNLRLKLPGVDTPYLQPLQALTVLREVHIDLDSTSRAFRIGTGMLSASHLKCLCLEGNVALEAGVLADKTELQHLSLGLKNLPGGAARVAQLLSELQHLHQLTYLDLQGSMRATADNPPAAAFSALTASSKLQYLDISKCTLPAGVWQHILPRAGRQLEHLQELEISGVWLPTGDFAAAPDGSRLVSCCPGLQSLCMQCLQSRAEQLAPLQDLSGLRSLSLTTSAEQSNQVLWVAASLTGLRQLGLCVVGDFDQLALLQVTQLKHLTALSFDGHLSGALTRLELSSKVSLKPCMAHMTIVSANPSCGSALLLGTCSGCLQRLAFVHTPAAQRNESVPNYAFFC